MLNQVLLAARFWMGQNPSVAFRGSLESASRLLAAFKGFTRWGRANNVSGAQLRASEPELCGDKWTS